MIEQRTQNPETQIQLEAPYITSIKRFVRERIPSHVSSFDTLFNHINTELMRKSDGENEGGLFISESKKYPGVKYLVGHFKITDEVVRKIAGYTAPDRKTQEESSEPKQEERRIDHVVRFLQPAFGIGKDGSGLSVLDMSFSPALDLATMIAASVRRGEKPPTGDIYVLGIPYALGGETTKQFNEKMGQARKNGRGLDPYGELFAEFIEAHVPSNPEELAHTRIVVEGISKGTASAQRTVSHLSNNVRTRTQLLLDNPAAVHGKFEEDIRVNRTLKRRLMNIPTQIGRGTNLLGFVGEVGVRSVTSSFGKTLTKYQPQFYLDIANALGIHDDSKEQAALKRQLRIAEARTLVTGAPLDKGKKVDKRRRLNIKSRVYEKVSSPDTANTSFKTIRKRLTGRYDVPLFYEEGNTVIFPNTNKTHMWPWMRSIDTGSWLRKIKFIENTFPPKAA